MSSGNQYAAATSAVTTGPGYFFLDTTALTLTVGNFDINWQAAFPVDSVFQEYVVGPTVVKVNIFSSSNELSVTTWIDLTSVTAPTTDTSQYVVVDYVERNGSALTPESMFFLTVSFFRNSGATGPTGAIGEQGPQGDVGQEGPTGAAGLEGPTGAIGEQGPTGAVSQFGLASLRSTGSSQVVADNTDTDVALGSFDIPSTNTNDLTGDTTSGLVTCVAVGVYEVTGRINWTSTVAGGLYQLAILVNGTPSQAVNSAVPASAVSVSDNGQTITSFINVTSANTTIGLRVTQNSGLAQTLSATGTVASYLFVRRVA